MELNLRKARKLEASIQNHLNSTSMPENKISVRVKETVKKAQDKIKEGKEEFDSGLNERLRLVETRYIIRRLIEKANEDVGINELINKKVLLQRKTEQLFGAAQNPGLTKEELKDELELRKKHLEEGGHNEYSLPKTTMNVSVFSEKDVEDMKDRVALIQRELETLDDELSAKNLNNKIVLSKDATKLLQAQRLM